MIPEIDTELVERAQAGDESAFTEMATMVGPGLHDVAYRMLRDRMLAEDVTQQALVDIWRNLPRLREPSKVAGWSYRILVRLCYRESDRLRQRITEILHAPVVSDAADVVADRDQLERAFRTLPMDQRAVIVLRHHVGMNTQEVAGALAIPPETVRTRLRRGLEAMRAALDADMRPSVSVRSDRGTVR